jgi:tetratricopeptide (TPR) repeat protein
LMEMLRNNPEEALKYAIPLDKDGVSRGGGNDAGSLGLDKLWKDFDLFRNSSGGGGGSGGSIESNLFFKLMEQYRKTAEELIKKGEFKKAAFVYLKLLKNHTLAAQTLEKGFLFAEAAAIYLKFLNNKAKAAECYEKANMIGKAIELYKELENWEKVGDLYKQLNMLEEARKFYDMVIENYVKAAQYVKASLVYRYKIGDSTLSQDLLKRGWLEGKDAYNCLNNYFVNFEDIDLLGKEIAHIFEHEMPAGQISLFLTAIRLEHEKHSALRELTLGLAYEIISGHPQLVSELRHFNEDKQLVKDIMRYRVG